MEEKREDQINENKKTNEEIIKQVEEIKKREKYLKIITAFLIIIVFSSLGIIYLFYSNYKKMEKTIEETTKNLEETIQQASNSYEEILKNQISTFTSFETSSLSKIGSISKDIIENATKPQNIKEVEELVDEYYNEPAISQFIEKLKNDPDMKEIFEAPEKERPMKIFKKMNDPVFMQKMTKEFMSNPELIKSMTKMATDPRVQQLMKDGSKNQDPKNTIKKNQGTNSSPVK